MVRKFIGPELEQIGRNLRKLRESLRLPLTRVAEQSRPRLTEAYFDDLEWGRLKVIPEEAVRAYLHGCGILGLRADVFEVVLDIDRLIESLHIPGMGPLSGIGQESSSQALELKATPRQITWMIGCPHGKVKRDIYCEGCRRGFQCYFMNAL